MNRLMYFFAILAMIAANGTANCQEKTESLDSVFSNPKFQNELGVTDEQLEQIEPIVAERAAKVKANPNLAEFEQAKAMSKIQKILKPQQALKLDVLLGNVNEKVAVDFGGAEKAETKKVTAEKKVKFAFGKTPWKDIIEWISDEADLALRMETFPEGSFSYVDDDEFTIPEAIDFLNQFLLRQDFCLIRNKKMLMVVDFQQGGIPVTVLETVEPEDLDDRGKYEIVKCRFELKNVSGEDFQDEIEAIVDENRGEIILVESANQMIIRETAGNLRLIRGFLDDAERKAADRMGVVSEVKLEHILPDELMLVVRPLMGMDPDENFLRDDNDDELRISYNAYDSRILLNGSSALVDRFKQIVKLMDIPSDAAEEENQSIPYFHTYRTKADPVIVEQVFRRLFGGTVGMRMARDEVTGFIIVQATKEQHAEFQAAVDAVEEGGLETTIIPLTKTDAIDMIDVLKRLNKIETDETGKTIGTLMIEESPLLDGIIVRGTPAEVEIVRKQVATIDPPIGMRPGGRSSYRILDIAGSEAERKLTMLGQIAPNMAVENKIMVQVPGKDPVSLSDVVKMQGLFGDQSMLIRPKRSSEPRSQNSTPELQPIESPQQRSAPPILNRLKKAAEDIEGNSTSQNSARPEIRSEVGRAPQFVVAYRKPSKPQEDTLNPKSAAPAQEESPADQEGETFTPSETPRDKTVPGAPITISVADGTLILSSQDLDALDVLEQFLVDESVGSSVERPKIFPLRHRKAEEAKGILGMILGTDGGGGGGGGGGLGGIVGGMAQNMVGGAMGNMLGGMLGGGGGGGASASSRTSGDVTMVSDVRNNSLIVFANDDDLQLIEDLLEFIDLEEPPQDPALEGKTRSIKVIYRDAQTVVDIVKQNLAARIKSGQGQSQARPQGGAEAQILQQLLRGGRGGRGGGSASVQQEEPKFAITADTEASLILVTGPQYLYQDVLEMVQLIDTADAIEAKESEVMDIRIQGNPEYLRKYFQALGVQVGDGSQSTAGASGGRSTGSTARQPTGQTDPAAAVRQMMERGAAIRAMMQGGGGRGGATGGRGGSTRGGGGRGGGRGGR